MAFARRHHHYLLGHEFREHQGSFEPRFFGGTDFRAAFRGHLPDSPCGKASPVPLPKLEGRTPPVYLRHHRMHALFLDRKYSPYAFAHKQRLAHRLFQRTPDHDFRRNLLQERAPRQTTSSRMPRHVHRHGTRGAERKVRPEALSRRRLHRFRGSTHVGGLFSRGTPTE